MLFRVGLLAALVTGVMETSAVAATPRAFTLGRTAATTIALDRNLTVYAAHENVGGIRRLRARDRAFAPLRLPSGSTRAVRDLAVAGDGALLWVDGTGHRVWRRAPDGTAAPVAGLEGVCPMAIDTTPDGDLLVVDNLTALRLLQPGAPLKTLWSSPDAGGQTTCFDGGGGLGDAAMTRDGTVFLLIDGTVSSLAPDGTPHPLPGVVNAEAIDDAADGSLLITTGDGVARRAVGDARGSWLARFTYERDDLLFDADGGIVGDLARALGTHGAAAAMPDGGWAIPAEVTSDQGHDRVVYVAGRDPARLAVALMGRAGRLGPRGYVAALRTSRSARLRLTVIRRGQVVAAASRDVAAGRVGLAVGRGLRLGAATVRVSALGRDGQVARDSLRLFLGSVLPVRTARGLVPDTYDVAGCGIRRAVTPGGPARAADCSTEDVATRTGGCVRRDDLRVDCAYVYDDHGDRECRMHATRLSALGTLREADADLNCPASGPVRLPARWTVGADRWSDGRLP